MRALVLALVILTSVSGCALHKHAPPAPIVIAVEPAKESPEPHATRCVLKVDRSLACSDDSMSIYCECEMGTN